MSSPIWITEAEVVSLIDMGEAIQAIEHAFEAEAAGAATNLLKTHLTLPAGSVHSIGGVLSADNVVGVKSWTHTAGGATPLLTLWNSIDGSLLAVIEAFALGQYRTAGVAGAATHALARADATHLAVLGTGHQAITQAGAIIAVRQIDAISVWSPNVERRGHFAQSVADALGVPSTAAESVQEACADADIITIITRAQTPFLSADAVSPGTHVNALGAITPERAEFEPKLLARCDVVAVDSVEQTRKLSQEFNQFYGDSDDEWAAVKPLSGYAGDQVRRPADADVTLFKSMGVGIADVSIGLFVYQQARENRIGAPLSAPSPSRPRLRSNLHRAAVGYV